MKTIRHSTLSQPVVERVGYVDLHARGEWL